MIFNPVKNLTTSQVLAIRTKPILFKVTSNIPIFWKSRCQIMFELITYADFGYFLALMQLKVVELVDLLMTVRSQMQK